MEDPIKINFNSVRNIKSICKNQQSNNTFIPQNINRSKDNNNNLEIENNNEEGDKSIKKIFKTMEQNYINLKHSIANNPSNYKLDFKKLLIENLHIQSIQKNNSVNSLKFIEFKKKDNSSLFLNNYEKNEKKNLIRNESKITLNIQTYKKTKEINNSSLLLMNSSFRSTTSGNNNIKNNETFLSLNTNQEDNKLKMKSSSNSPNNLINSSNFYSKTCKRQFIQLDTLSSLKNSNLRNKEKKQINEYGGFYKSKSNEINFHKSLRISPESKGGLKDNSINNKSQNSTNNIFYIDLKRTFLNKKRNKEETTENNKYQINNEDNNKVKIEKNVIFKEIINIYKTIERLKIKGYFIDLGEEEIKFFTKEEGVNKINKTLIIDNFPFASIYFDSDNIYKIFSFKKKITKENDIEMISLLKEIKKEMTNKFHELIERKKQNTCK